MSEAQRAPLRIGRPPSVERLVIEANRIFHDLEGSRYEEKHDEIFVAETERWARIAERYLKSGPTALSLLDLGTGTGFVPRAIGTVLDKEDEYVLSDLSLSMLACAREHLEREPIPCRVRFEPVDGESYPFPSKSFDAITGNSVIHHVPDLPRLFGELDRILRPGGLILIGHEPNALHYRDRALARSAALAGAIAHPARAMLGLARRLGVRRLADLLGLRRTAREALLRARGAEIAEQVRETESIVDRVALELVERGIVDRAPSREQIVRWVDFHSPTAGPEVDPERGIDIESIRSELLPDYELIHHETYDHLPSYGHADRRSARARILDRRLARRYPNSGATLFSVLLKP